MKPPARKSLLRKVLTYLALTASALVVFVVVKHNLPTRVPPDQELTATFRAHRHVFEQIQAMAAKDMQDGLPLRWYRESWWCSGSWWCRGSSKPSAMPPSRWEDYGNLISQIRPKVESVAIGHNGAISFTFAAGGTGLAVGPGWSKGIAYIPPEVNPKEQGDNYVREIEPTWFIFYDRFDD